MRVFRQLNGELTITLPSDANRSLGLLLIFLGTVTSAPLWYLWCAWVTTPPRTVHDWIPSLFLAAAMIVPGYLLAAQSRKRICVAPDHIRIWDGLLQRPLRFQWTCSPPTIKLQQVENQVGGRTRTLWMTKLVCERYEYILDERLEDQLTCRATAEVIARALGAPLCERCDDGSCLCIDARDLDLPFRDRVLKYPALAGTPVARPQQATVSVSENGATCTFSWGVATTGLAVDILLLGALFLVITLIPPRHGQCSVFSVARNTGDYGCYLWLAGLITACLAMVSGFRVRLTLTPERVSLRETIWGVPLSRRDLAADRVEEVRVNSGMRGATVQVLSTRALLQFRVGGEETAAWLASEIRRHLLEAAGFCLIPRPADPATIAPV